MQLGEIGNPDAILHGKPLDGVRILAAEQMQSLPFATQLLARLGADVVKVEHPVHGESGRGSTPAMADPEGRNVGATFLRNNFNKRSLGLNLRSDDGRDLFLRLVPRFDVVADNFKAGTMAKFGLGYDDIAAAHPGPHADQSAGGQGHPSGEEDRPGREAAAFEARISPVGGVVDRSGGRGGGERSAAWDFAAVLVPSVDGEERRRDGPEVGVGAARKPLRLPGADHAVGAVGS